MEEALASNQVPWANCFGIVTDNASVNTGGYNSVKTRVLQKNSATYVMGCPCHIVHNMADKASQAFGAASGFDVEDFCIDVYCWFDKSTQWKSTLIDYYEFCDLEYRKIIKQVSTRCLSLETDLNRILHWSEQLFHV